jgi:hypothetical protein
MKYIAVFLLLIANIVLINARDWSAVTVVHWSQSWSIFVEKIGSSKLFRIHFLEGVTLTLCGREFLSLHSNMGPGIRFFINFGIKKLTEAQDQQVGLTISRY